MHIASFFSLNVYNKIIVSYFEGHRIFWCLYINYYTLLIHLECFFFHVKKWILFRNCFYLPLLEYYLDRNSFFFRLVFFILLLFVCSLSLGSEGWIQHASWDNHLPPFSRNWHFLPSWSLSTSLTEPCVMCMRPFFYYKFLFSFLLCIILFFPPPFSIPYSSFLSVF